jgi:transposase
VATKEHSYDLLGLPSLRSTGRTDHGHHYVVSVKLSTPADRRCPHCGATALVGHGQSEPQRVADIPLHDKPTRLELRLPRFKCKACNATSTPRPDDLHATRRMTWRLIRKIEEKGLEQSYPSIAHEVGLDVETIASICAPQRKARLAAHQAKMPRILCVDEVRLRKGVDYAVFTDFASGRILDLLPDMKPKTVEAALRRLADRERCKIVTMDGCPNYRRAVREVLPHAMIVMDKWHVLNKIDKAMATVIEEEYRRLPEERRKATPRMQADGLMRTRLAELGPEKQAKLDYFVGGHPRLEEVYQVKEAFNAIYDNAFAVDVDEAASRFDAWEAALSPHMSFYFTKAIGYVRRHREEILNHWRAPERPTNAMAENRNRAIKRIDDKHGRALGFEALRSLVLIGEAQRADRVAARRVGFRNDREARAAARRRTKKAPPA